MQQARVERSRREHDHRDAEPALARAREWLLARQSPEGYWKGELQTNVTMDAEDLLLRQFLGVRTEEQTTKAAAWIRSQQRDDGTWANAFGAPADLSTTVESYVALRLAGDAIDAPHMKRAAEYIRENGGIPATRVFTRVWLALFGLWDWSELPDPPAGDEPASAVGAAQRLRFRVLGAPDGRRADDRHDVQARAADPRPDARRARADARRAPSAPTWRGRVFQGIDRVLRSLPEASALASSASARSARRSVGSCGAKRRTARGAASSRRGSTRSWRSRSAATRWITP